MHFMEVITMKMGRSSDPAFDLPVLIVPCSWLKFAIETALYALCKSLYWLSGFGVSFSRDYSFSPVIAAVGGITYLYAVVFRLQLSFFRPLAQPNYHPGNNDAYSSSKKFKEYSCTSLVIERCTDIR